MPVLPILLLLTIAVAAWLVRNRPERVVWGVSASGYVLVWASLLFLHRQVPTAVQISVWRPSRLFVTPIALQLDSVGWAISFALASLMLAISLTSVSRVGSATPATRTFMSVFGALGMAAAMAGNLLTVAVTWALIDVVAFASYLVLVRQPEMVPLEITRLGVGGISVVCVLASTSLAAVTGTGSAGAEMAALLVLAGGILRLGLLPAHYQLPTLPGVRRGLGTLLRLAPVGVGLAVIARQIDAAPMPAISSWLAWVGALVALVAGARWALHEDPVEKRPMLVLSLVGLSLTGAGLTPNSAGTAITSGAATVILVGGMASLAVPHESWHRGWVVLAGLVVLGLPGMPGQSLTGALVVGLQHPSTAVPALLGCVALVGVMVGLLRLSLEKPTAWVSGEDLVRFTYASGLGLPFVSALLVGLWLAPSPNWGVVMLAVGLAAISAMTLIGGWRRGNGRAEQMAISFARWRVPVRLHWAARTLDRWLSALTWLSGLFEGEAAFLWVLFLLLILAAVSGAAR